MVVLVEPADVAVDAGEQRLLDLPAPERHVGVEAPRLVFGDGMAREAHVRRTVLRDGKPRRRVHRVPEAEVFDLDAELIEPGGEVAGEERAAREAEEEDARRRRAGRRRRNLRLVPAAGAGEDGAPADAGRLSEEKRPDVRARPSLQVALLRCVFEARLVDERDVRLPAVDTLPRPLEEQREVHSPFSLRTTETFRSKSS